MAEIDLNQVMSLLKQGANPNQIYRAQEFVIDNQGQRRAIYRADGNVKWGVEEVQPSTPLKTCVFIFSNDLCSPGDRRKIIQIARLLIQYGADVLEALDYFVARYFPGKQNNMNHKTKEWKDFYELLQTSSTASSKEGE